LKRQFPLVTPQGGFCWRVLILHDLLDDAQRDTLKSIYQALGVLMERMSYHVVDFLAHGSGALFQREILIHSIDSAFGREPVPPDAVVAGPLERPDEIGFKEGFDLIELLLVFRSQFFVRDWVPLRHPNGRS
jgi:hypothetical protein